MRLARAFPSDRSDPILFEILLKMQLPLRVLGEAVAGQVALADVDPVILQAINKQQWADVPSEDIQQLAVFSTICERNTYVGLKLCRASRKRSSSSYVIQASFSCYPAHCS